MLFWALALVQWAHIAFGILWVGTGVTLKILVDPATAGLPLGQRREVGRRIGARAGPIFAVVGAGTMLLGIVRGTVLGPVQSPAALASPYGMTWLAALAIAAALAVLGARLVGPAAERLYGDDSLWLAAADGRPPAALAAARRRLALLGNLELAGFAAILACMVLLGIGL